MKNRIVSFLAVLVLLFSSLPILGTASPENCTPCQNVSIVGFTITGATGQTVPAHIGLIGTVAGPVKRVTYKITDAVTGALACSCSSFCPKCTGKGTCICSCTISKSGTYNVEMTAYGKDGCCVSLVKSLSIVVKEKVPILKPCFTTVIKGHSACFRDCSTCKNCKGKIDSWKWDFGDGNTSTLRNPCHIYATKGIYKVCLTVDKVGCVNCSKTLCKTITIKR